MRLSVLVAGFLLCVTAAARADTVYSYVGQNYSTATPPYTTTESVTGSFAVSSPLAGNLSNATITPTDFSFSDGIQTLTLATDLSQLFSVSTDASGNITGYNIQINSLTLGFIKLLDLGPGFTGDSVRLVSAVSAGNTTAGSFTGGPATTAAAPEPATILLLGTGLLGFVGVARKRSA